MHLCCCGVSWDRSRQITTMTCVGGTMWKRVNLLENPMRIRESYSRVLVVEDEEVVAFFLREVLTEAGYHVHTVADGASALSAMQQAEWGAAIVDVGLPDISGLTVVERLRDHDPELPILIATGFDDEVRRHPLPGVRTVRVIPKPFDEPQILHELHALLDIPRRGESVGSCRMSPPCESAPAP